MRTLAEAVGWLAVACACVVCLCAAVSLWAEKRRDRVAARVRDRARHPSARPVSTSVAGNPFVFDREEFMGLTMPQLLALIRARDEASRALEDVETVEDVLAKWGQR